MVTEGKVTEQLMSIIDDFDQENGFFFDQTGVKMSLMNEQAFDLVFLTGEKFIISVIPVRS